ncbi:MAG: hypothetical protein UT48_C0032G0013 [Parcubacteria group bacterium GW2011_GWE2_39_37]|uniref:Metallophosphoesterase n=1 Tax=Candidatus Falkowbacteria bacterium GW2011_GWF2_39_8 TaxID=1618642 RepID=A0A0G0Q0R0_9BACT|nr:MAG: hypothetical protein UT48_C0032G0013 [Parcubacteria group bacterium GW2011_GWE2_39_37]KKR33934.1 MAG: hypothetical protein UT64_C0001G0008 [Candidatus Falkowbacteria bacterium GW2011_GWF2_39_8]
MLKILFFGDINGKIGRKALKKALPQMKKEFKPDVIIANAENAAHGKGITEATIVELMEAGVEFFTLGDHAFDRETQAEQIFTKGLPVVRPANFPTEVPGKGYSVIKKGKHKILVINLLGRVFMSMDYNCPFREIEAILAVENLASENLSAIIVDIHAEATSEKIAMGYYLDGKVSAVLGTHTHVMTNDAKITESGTAYITDVGMVGASDGVLGVKKEDIIKTFLTQVKYKHEIPESGPAMLNGVLVTIDEKSKKAIEIKSIIKNININ